MEDNSGKYDEIDTHSKNFWHLFQYFSTPVPMKCDVIAWKPDDDVEEQLYMYGFIRQNNSIVAIANF